MFIASIGYSKGGNAPEFKSFGSIWYNDKNHSASLLLKGFRFGQFFAKPYPAFADKAPYLEGDMFVATGDYGDDSIAKKEYLWCGWMWTCSDQRGAIYNGVLEIDPTPSIMMREIESGYEGRKRGIMLNIKLIDGGK